MFRIASLSVALTVASLATATPFINLAQPLQVAPAGMFRRDVLPGSANAFPDIQGNCTAVYNAGVANVTLPSGPKTVLSLSGSCNFNNTVLSTAHPFFQLQGINVSFNLLGELSTSSCGLSNQIGMAYGFLGGQFVTPSGIAPLCVYYTRLSATDLRPAVINLAIYYGVWVNGQSLVGCPADRPSLDALLLSLCEFLRVRFLMIRQLTS